jgi:hypothetical protein
MQTLVLGHGKIYANPSAIYCSPIPLDDWINQPYISVDMRADVQPDIVYDLTHMSWTFATNGSYDRIIDTTGIALKHYYRSDTFKAEIRRILKPGGIFYGRRGYTIQNI